MHERVTTERLQVGMYVILPVSWYNHPFLKSHFLITSADQIQKIRESGIKELLVDPDRSRLVPERREAPDRQASASAPDAPLLELNSLLKDCIKDRGLPPREKATAVQHHAMATMRYVMEHPSAANIKQTKENLAGVVDLILKEDETAAQLLTITSHDFYTYTHSLNVGIYGVSLAKALFQRSNGHDMHALGNGFFLHDLGKVRIDLAILNKPGRLSDDEMNVIRRHPGFGYTLLADAKQIDEESRIIVLQHHEREDGGGYPKRVRGGDIHVYARICSIADVFDALTSDRPYRKPMPIFDALKLMRDEMIHHFQKDLFERFVLLFV